MKLLSKSAQADIARQMTYKSRDIDMCLMNALDGTMPKDFLLDCLMLYQTKDGGFAGGLHIDNYNTNTSVYQIYEAFRLMSLLEFDSSCDNELYTDIVNKACNYLYNRAEIKDNKWNANTKTNNDFAHAQIFTYSEENTALLGYHPTAALIGYTLLYCKPTKAYYKKALKMVDILLKDFDAKEELNRYELISFGSFLDSIKKLGLFTECYEKIEKKLIANAEKLISDDVTDPEAVKATEVALYINSKIIDEKRQKELDYMIDNIAPHGLWNHDKKWGYDKYAEEDSAMIKWVGAESVNNYYLLKKYGRIEE